MNTRKFYLILSVAILVFLFVSGGAILAYLNNTNDLENAPFGDILIPFKPGNEPVNILVMGGDKVNKNTDTMMLVNINPASSKVNILSIPRDTKAKVKGSNVPKINSAYPLGGAKRAIETVSSLLSVRIKYYVYIDTSTFRQIIDSLGGVDYDVPVDMNYDDPFQNLHIHIKAGPQHFDGQKAEQFMRFRHPTKYTKEVMKYYDGSDLKRIDAQQSFIKEVIRQKANVYYITKMKDIINIAFKNVETNITLNEALKMSGSIGKLKLENVNMFKLEGEARLENGISYYVHDKAKANEIIKQYFNVSSGFISNISTDPGESKNSSTKPKPSSKPAPTGTTKKDSTNDNPSNAETSIKPTTQDDP